VLPVPSVLNMLGGFPPRAVRTPPRLGARATPHRRLPLIGDCSGAAQPHGHNGSGAPDSTQISPHFLRAPVAGLSTTPSPSLVAICTRFCGKREQLEQPMSGTAWLRRPWLEEVVAGSRCCDKCGVWTAPPPLAFPPMGKGWG